MSRSKRSLKREAKRGLDSSLLEKTVDEHQSGIELGRKYLDHELKGDFKGFRECYI